MGHRALCSLLLVVTLLSTAAPYNLTQEGVEESLAIMSEVSRGGLCVSEGWKTLPVRVDPSRFDLIRQKTELAALLLKRLPHSYGGVGEAVARGLVESGGPAVVAGRLVTVNRSSGLVGGGTVWRRRSGVDPDALPPPGLALPLAPWATSSHWSPPYYSCSSSTWLVSFTLDLPPNQFNQMSSLLSVDVDVSDLELNQCDEIGPGQLSAFRGTHKCHNTTLCVYDKGGRGWARGSYTCRCREGYFSPERPAGFPGALVEAGEEGGNWSSPGRGGRPGNVEEEEEDERFSCVKCSPGCRLCQSSAPCLAAYNWPFRSVLLCFSACCVLMTLTLIAYVYHHRRLKVFKVASPIFLCITLLGCAVMYSEMAAIFPILDTYSCIATKWSRHLGFCITYTALLMKTWRVSLTYRVKSAHKVKLTDKQLLQWMLPVLLVMVVYLGAWTLGSPPTAHKIDDSHGLAFKQCSFDWWDHSLAVGEVMFLGWGIRVCYNVRNAESLFNEARLISYAIYNIAIVNTTMVAFHVFLFPRAGPDIKYLLGFIRTQLSTTVTVLLVFGPKVVRVARGQGDQWDNRARARAVTASFSLNGIGLVKEETTDLYQENEELKEEIQKLAGQIEFMKIVSMEMNNRHLKPKAGGYFCSSPAPDERV